MQYYSILDHSHKVSFKQAIINGLAPNFGLYFPEEIPRFSERFYEQLPDMKLPEVAQHVLRPYVEEDIPDTVLKDICEDVFNFEIPLVEVEENIFALELFHGPTLAFKDIGARFLARSLQYLSTENNIRVLVATSGDTGSAVANGFLGVKGTDVVVLYPKGKVSELQRKQFTTLGQNIIPIAIEGTFDDCQRLVKQAFADAELKAAQSLTSANSINIARWIPQSVYYYWALAQAQKLAPGQDINIAVPSGNLGNITSGILAKATGLKIKQFIAVSNRNDVVPQYIASGKYEPITTIQTIANAMDVGDPNNFPRFLELHQHNYDLLKDQMAGASYNDEEIRDLIRSCKAANNYLLDPHGATGYGALRDGAAGAGIGIFLETAHPGKFVEEVEATLGEKITLPAKLQEFAKRTINTHELPADFGAFKNFLETH